MSYWDSSGKNNMLHTGNVNFYSQRSAVKIQKVSLQVLCTDRTGSSLGTGISIRMLMTAGTKVIFELQLTGLMWEKGTWFCSSK